MTNPVYSFSDVAVVDNCYKFGVSFEVSETVDTLINLGRKWAEADKVELFKYLGIKMRQMNKDADMFIDVPLENKINREVNYKGVVWLLDGITHFLPEIVPLVMGNVVKKLEGLKGATRATLVDITSSDNIMTLHFESRVKSNVGAIEELKNLLNSIPASKGDQNEN